MEKHQQGKFSRLTFLNPKAKTRTVSSPCISTPYLVSDLSFASESSPFPFPGPHSTPTVCFQTCLSTPHYHWPGDSCLCPCLSSSQLLPLLPSCHFSVVSLDQSLPSLALAPLPVGYTALGSGRCFLSSISSGSPNRINNSISTLLPFVLSNNCWEAGQRCQK